MSDLAAALSADPDKQETFEEIDVVRTEVAVTNAGDGLSRALAIQPNDLELGTRVYVVLECLVQQIKFKPAVDRDHPEDGLARVHVLRAGAATIVDRTVVASAMDAQAERIRLAEEAAAGIQRLSTSPDPGSDPDEER